VDNNADIKGLNSTKCYSVNIEWNNL